MTTHNKPNRLAKEKSPYLLQHALNPVDWFPWSEEAFDKAKQENKPVFLSIGYSTCHWCHVMAHESFEDDEVATILNEHYISIKVDREERPDVDHLYMTVCQAMTGQGGWPLTIIMTPDKKPFFAGTYYPKNRRYGRHGLMNILPQLAGKWKEDRERMVETSDQIVTDVEQRMLSNLKGEVSEQTLDQAFAQFEEVFDPSFGGFGDAPKFPTSHNFSFLLRYYHRTGKESALQMVEKTLDAMQRGGMYDHIGFGFARYSVDERWMVPHFEKMLYDNALLAWTYLEAYQLTGQTKYSHTAEEIFTYVLRDMTDPEGGFYSAEDADSEGHEGKFYVWKPEEILQVLGDEEGELYCDLYDITEEGNFEGHSIPNLIQHDVEMYARLKGLKLDELTRTIERCRQTLFSYREQRVHPGKDDKVLTSWNGLMIMALAKGYKVLERPQYLEAAARSARFIISKIRRPDGRLLARYRDGEAAFAAYLDDYAFMVWGLIELYEASFELEFLKLAVELNEQMIELFWDEENGGLFFYGSDSEQLFTRNKEIYDGALPSGNAVAAMNFLKLSKLTYDARLSQIAERQLQAFAGSIERYPTGHSMFLIALDYAYSPSSEIVIAGDLQSNTTTEMIAAARQGFRPHTLVFLVPTGEEGEKVRELIPLVQDKQAIGGRPTVYVCENFACYSPTTDIEEFKEALLPQ
ncbi:thioredoxin domain-containing protein [Paenibacillus sp. RC67]|uniref:thioredoxin domain-containing protein n=1 Tax=Paenibacillus sp. RC67 TaxID=3039392 RepID=UPI0024ADB983|nr:thioredoxin domain-containing protein [Paenibacillus sp. RC67]